MRRMLRWLGYGAAAIAMLALLAACWVWFVSWRAINSTEAPVAERLVRPTAAQLADAPRQTRILGCVSCHGEGLRGRRMFHEKGVATVWASNLTEVAARATDQQLAQAIRQGVGHDGRPLWVMPSALFSRLGDGEVAALIAWIRRLPRSGGPTPETYVGPIGRLGIALGRFKPGPATIERFRTTYPIDAGAEHAAGRRLAATACAECHGPRLEGGTPGPGTTAPALDLAAAYDLNQFRTLLRTGIPPGGRDLGLMKTVAVQDFAHLTDEEIAQLHSYLSARFERLAQ
ncbi:MAG TPA: cytochrome c [Allosphingosinicella sp.]